MNALVLMTLTLLTQAPNEADPGSYRPATTAAEAVKRIESRGGAVRKVARKGDALEVDFQFSHVDRKYSQSLNGIEHYQNSPLMSFLDNRL